MRRGQALHARLIALCEAETHQTWEVAGSAGGTGVGELLRRAHNLLKPIPTNEFQHGTAEITRIILNPLQSS